ncbi:MAG: GTPase domain-containing protein [Enterobacterales bacterium]|nr:GTPase domain-containing protein [Enterobacterales bacterium]
MEFLRASFAVVGHPNKGKSSIVSTLAKNDNVAISRRSGTTTHSHYFKIDTGNAGFELIDTPGFQRPQKVLQWLKQKSPQCRSTPKCHSTVYSVAPMSKIIPR